MSTTWFIPAMAAEKAGPFNQGFTMFYYVLPRPNGWLKTSNFKWHQMAKFVAPLAIILIPQVVSFSVLPADFRAFVFVRALDVFHLASSYSPILWLRLSYENTKHKMLGVASSSQQGWIHGNGSHLGPSIIELPISSWDDVNQIPIGEIPHFPHWYTPSSFDDDLTSISLSQNGFQGKTKPESLINLLLKHGKITALNHRP